MIEAGAIGFLVAFAAGVISFLSPCVLPLVPGYVSYIAGKSLPRGGTGSIAIADRTAALLLSACFVLGFSVVFIALGASATAIGRWLLQYRYEAGVIGGAVVALFGLAMMLGTERIPILRRGFHFHVVVPGGRPASGFILGLAFAFGWTPCIGPILGAILTAAAISESAGAGIALLSAYSFGLGVPFLLTALFLREMAGKWQRLSEVGRHLQTAAGGLMVLMGAAMMTGRLTAFSYWLLETFPVLGKIG